MPRPAERGKLTHYVTRRALGSDTGPVSVPTCGAKHVPVVVLRSCDYKSSVEEGAAKRLFSQG